MSATDFETANETAGATSAPGIDAIVAGSVVPLAVVVVAAVVVVVVVIVFVVVVVVVCECCYTSH